MELERWPHQQTGLARWLDAYDRGVKRTCLCYPTGGGKTLTVADVIKSVTSIGRKASLFTNRKILTDQVIADLLEHRIDHGVRAAGHEEDLSRSVQICSMQTEVSRVLKRKVWDLHANAPGDVMIIDEGHLHVSGHALTIRDMTTSAGAFTLDMTATPIGMGEVCDEIVYIGKNSEMRACKAHLLIEHYAPDEPDMRLAKLAGTPKKGASEGEDLSENQQRAVMGAVVDGEANKRLRALHGRIWDNFCRLNPNRLPFLCFGPGVEESIWIAQQFTKRGVRCAHVDGEHIWMDGSLYRKTDALWEQVLDENRAGTLPGLSCRFVLREGFNAPWLKHGILATVFGSVQSYLQAGGRFSRYFPDYESKTLQDHGGNFWRHGSLNIDREYTLQDTASSIYFRRSDSMREKKQREPVVCPQCGMVLTRSTCKCGWVRTVQKVPRAFLTSEGTLIESNADYFPPIRRSTSPVGSLPYRNWEVMYRRFCTCKSFGTFRQAEGLYAHENRGIFPSRDWPLMPINPLEDMTRKVLLVDVSRLRGAPDLLARMRAHQQKQLAKMRASENGEIQDPQATLFTAHGTGPQRKNRGTRGEIRRTSG
jgi:superfamily II DNA or RNA helicase